MDRRRFLTTLLATAGAAATSTLGARSSFGALARLTAPEPPVQTPAGLPETSTEPPSPDAPTDEPQKAPSQTRRSRREVALARALPPGTVVAGAIVESVGGNRCGAVPIVMRDQSGKRFQVDVTHRDWLGSGGIGNTRQLSLYLSNGGQGATPTAEAHGLAVLALAHRLRALERRGARWPHLLTQRERLAQHPGGAYQIC